MLNYADVVLLIGARLNWLLSHGKGKTWGEPGSKEFIQIDIDPKEMDSIVHTVAPLVGDIGSCVSALLEGIDGSWPAPPADWVGAINARKAENIAKMAPRLMKYWCRWISTARSGAAHRHQGAAGCHPRQRRRQHA